MSLHALTMLCSFTVSTLALGATVSALTVGIVADHYGRRNSILIANSLSLMAVAFMGVSKIAGSLEALIVGRFLIGLFCGLNMTLIPLYIQEISPTRVRGAFSTMNQLSQTVGIFVGQIMSLENVLGTSRWWPLMLSLSAIPAILQYLTLPFCPESPRYFIINCHEDELAARELQRLRGTQDVLEEIEEMKEEAAKLKGTEDVIMLRLFIVPSYKQPILIALILNASSQLSGFNAIINYSTKIFRLAGVAHPTHTTMGIGAINILFTIFSVFLVERLGRRSLLMFGQFVMALCNMLLTLSIATLHLVGPYVFLLFTGFLVVAVLYTYFRVPETTGCTFKEVAAEFRQADAILTSCF
ncbi:solute carrier family 2, facilitated glucose transporter member 1-like [Terrapene carolina triunguis]|uniref:solute carrier family 2, facilitated glucose transporter member 1-like n=1 Tax=Terrapene triunguis TaxID=2587831 RepID=UPI000E77AD08|nr:solute carrier family 2, facilitated glucose transporter member 1-like [Terrapene carolina triunguis]